MSGMSRGTLLYSILQSIDRQIGIFLAGKLKSGNLPHVCPTATFPVREEAEFENQPGSSFVSFVVDCNRYKLLCACLAMLLMYRGLSLLPTASLPSILAVVMPL